MAKNRRKTGRVKPTSGGKKTPQKSFKDQGYTSKKDQLLDPQQVDVEGLFNTIKNDVLTLSNVHAISVIPVEFGQYQIRITVDEKVSAQGEQDILNSVLIMAPVLVAEDVVFARSKPLEFFAPYPVCAKHENAQGSCGPFFDMGNKRYVMSCAHVLPDPKGGKPLFYLAKLHDQTPATAKVTYSEPLIDVAFGELHSTPGVQWDLFPTTIVKAVEKEPVKHYGAASVEPSPGHVKSNLASINIIDTGAPGGQWTFHNVIHLEIDSRHGDSGSPVVNDNNEVIGMIIGGDASTGEIYCSDLDHFQRNEPDFKPKKIYLQGTPAPASILVPRNERRREIELFLRHGKIIKAAAPGVYGEIISDEKVSVMTHIVHSFDPNDPVDQGNQEKDVWFFAVPLEYVVSPEEMVGTGSLSPLLAINVSHIKRGLEPSSGRHKRTPCGTGTTI